MSDKPASLSQKIAGKRLIGFDTTNWGGHASAKVGGKPSKPEKDAAVIAKVGGKTGGKPEVGASIGAKAGLKPGVAAKVGSKPL
jgi:hypothetical protein